MSRYLELIEKSFGQQAEGFKKEGLNFTDYEYLDHIRGADPFYSREVQEGLAAFTDFVCNAVSFLLFCLKQYI